MAALSPESNPAFLHAGVVQFTAWKNGSMVGRVAGIVNHLETDLLGEKHVRFGWLDFIDDSEVSSILLREVEKWARQQGAGVLKGPYGFSQLDRAAMIIEGFNTLGTMGTIYNYPYYSAHLENLGFEKDLEWVEVRLRLAEKFPERFRKITEIAKERYGLKVICPGSKDELKVLSEHLFDLMMETYRSLPGFVPISDQLRAAYIKRFIAFLRLDLVRFVMTENNEPVGFGVTMPSLSKALRKAAGRLYPFGIFHIVAARRWFNVADLALLGVKDEWRQRGIHGLIFHATGESLLQKGVRHIRINPMLEFNSNVLSLWKDFDHEVYKRRRTYRKQL